MMFSSFPQLSSTKNEKLNFSLERSTEKNITPKISTQEFPMNHLLKIAGKDYNFVKIKKENKLDNNLHNVARANLKSAKCSHRATHMELYLSEVESVLDRENKRWKKNGYRYYLPMQIIHLQNKQINYRKKDEIVLLKNCMKKKKNFINIPVIKANVCFQVDKKNSSVNSKKNKKVILIRKKIPNINF